MTVYPGKTTRDENGNLGMWIHLEGLNQVMWFAVFENYKFEQVEQYKSEKRREING